MTHGLLFSSSLVMHHSFQMTPGLLFPKLINYASHPSSNDHGPFVSSHSKGTPTLLFYYLQVQTCSDKKENL